MPQPKKSTASRSSSRSKNTASRSRSRSTAAEPQPGVREQLTRLLNPLDAVVVTRERLQEVLDDAVQRGRMTRSDATDLMADIIQRGRAATEELLADVDQRLGSPADRVRREVDRARRATGIGATFPISGYESLTAAQVQARLEDLTPAQLRKVRDYERRNANRKTVLAAIESRLGG
jgi:polyhydroxyalkanoate synthesis regulator phasin